MGMRVGVPISAGYFAVSIALGIAAKNAEYLHPQILVYFICRGDSGRILYERKLCRHASSQDT